MYVTKAHTLAHKTLPHGIESFLVVAYESNVCGNDDARTALQDCQLKSSHVVSVAHTYSTCTIVVCKRTLHTKPLCVCKDTPFDAERIPLKLYDLHF